MGFWDSLKKGAGFVGDIASRAAPFATFIPGVGPVVAAGLGAGGALMGQLNDEDGFHGAITDVLKGGAIGGAGAFGLDKAMPLLQGIPGVGGVVNAAGGAGGGGILDAAKGFLSGGDGWDVGDVGKIAGAAGGIFGAKKGYDAYKQSGKDSARSRELLEGALARANSAADSAQNEFNLGADNRAAFRQGAANFRDPTNPFSGAIAAAARGAA